MHLASQLILFSSKALSAPAATAQHICCTQVLLVGLLRLKDFEHSPSLQLVNALVARCFEEARFWQHAVLMWAELLDMGAQPDVPALQCLEAQVSL